MLSIDSVINYCSILSPIQIKYSKTNTLYDNIIILKSISKNLKSNIIYICNASILNNLSLNNIPLTFFIIDDCALSKNILAMNYITIYKFPKTESTFSLYNYISKIFTENKKNYTYIEDLIKTLLSNNDLDEITDKVSLLLQNPIVIIDSSYKIISSSTSIQTDDTIWNTRLKKKSLSFEFIAQIRSVDRNNFENNPEFKILDFVGDNCKKRKLCKLFMENTFLGYCLILESNTSFENIPNSYYSLIADIISKQVSVRNMYKKQSFVFSYESILLDLLNNSFLSESIFLERIKNTKFDVNGKFTIALIDMNNLIDNNSLIQGTLKEQIYNVLPHSCSIFYDIYIVILINLNNNYYDTPLAFKSFNNMLIAHKLKVAFSDTFTNLYELSSYYQQSVSILKISKYLKDTSNIIKYDDYKPYDIIETLKFSHNPLLFCKNSIKIIHEYDKKNKTEYIKTLFTYLDTNKSVSKTATALFIHRNTVNYRISRIKELFNINFNDAYEDFQLYYSCLALNYIKRIQD